MFFIDLAEGFFDVRYDGSCFFPKIGERTEASHPRLLEWQWP